MLSVEHFAHSAIERRLDAARQRGDALADAFVGLLLEDSPQAAFARLYQWAERGGKEIPLMLYPEHPFWLHYIQMPDWADQRLLAAARQFFQKYAEDIMLLLGFLSLPYCYAAADGAKVLFRSKRILHDTRRRLAETAQFVLSVHEPNAFDLSDAVMPYAMRTIVTVRLMHAAVRYHLRRSGNWNSPLWGVPVNQEDMAGTNLAFSFIILRGLRKIGHALSHEETKAYLHLWNAVGHFLGIEEQLLPADEQTAARLDQAITRRHFKPSDEGRALTKALITSMEQNENMPLPMRAEGFVPAFMRFLLGDSVADLLDIPASRFPQSVFRMYRLKSQWQSFFAPQRQAPDFGALLRRLYGKPTYKLPERMP